MFTRVAPNAYISIAQRFLITEAIQNSYHLSNTNFPELKMARFTLLGGSNLSSIILHWSANVFFGLFLNIEPAQC